MTVHDTRVIEAALDHIRRVTTENCGTGLSDLVIAMAKRFAVSERTLWG